MYCNQNKKQSVCNTLCLRECYTAALLLVSTCLKRESTTADNMQNEQADKWGKLVSMKEGRETTSCWGMHSQHTTLCSTVAPRFGRASATFSSNVEMIVNPADEPAPESEFNVLLWPSFSRACFLSTTLPAVFLLWANCWVQVWTRSIQLPGFYIQVWTHHPAHKATLDELLITTKHIWCI